MTLRKIQPLSPPYPTLNVDGMADQPKRASYRNGALILAERDLVLGRLVAATGLPKISRPSGTPFAFLVRSVLYQQLAGSAAAAIHGRLLAELKESVTPERLLQVAPERLREIGLSRTKAAAITDLADKVACGVVDLAPRHLARRDDEDIIDELSQVKGIGRWTAQMFLMFWLKRLDVWPAGDFGVRRGYGLAWDIPMPTERHLNAVGAAFAPFRSVAAWYCWRACELYGSAKPSAATT